MRVIQMLPTISYGDAVGNDALALDAVLRNSGYRTGIYAERIGKRVPPESAKSITRTPKLKDEDIIIYHLSTGSDVNFSIANYPGKKIIVYHNVTPCEFFSGYSAVSWHLCKYGYEGVQFLSDKADYCLADSSYNKRELQRMGYNCSIDVLPILIPFDDYRKEPNKEVISKYRNDGYTNILFTGRIAPNKRQEDIIAAFYHYHKNYNDKSRLILVGNYEGMEEYHEDLEHYSKHLGLENSILFTGHIGFDEILAYYHIADVFLCMSEHEGFCVPLVEAMFFDIPIIAYDSSAISDTLGGSGFLLKEKNPLETAGVIDYIVNNMAIKESIVSRQRERLRDFSHETIEKRFLSYLESFIEGNK